jgi:hypothetical protein
MITMRRGLGSTNVEPIAQALMAGALHPTFQTTYYQPPYLPPGTQTEAPSWMYMDGASAGQIASLLGGSVFQSPPPNLPGAPPANWIRLGDGGQVMPGNLMQPGTVLSFGDLCAAENYFAQSIPGGIPGSHCGGAADPVAAAAAARTVATRNPPPPITTQGRPIVQQTVHPPIVTPASGSAPPAGSQVVTSSPGASPGAAPASGGIVAFAGPCGNMPCLDASACSAGQTFIPPGGTLSSGQVTQTGACQDATTVSGSWFTDPTQEMISGVPNWALLAAAALGLWAMNSGKGR